MGSSKARGKLSASLLSDAMFQQWNEFAASTGSELNSEDFSDFLRRMGFSQEFTAREVGELDSFLNGHQNVTDRPRTEPSAEEPAAEEPKAEEPAAAEEPKADDAEAKKAEEEKAKAEQEAKVKKAQQDKANMDAKKKRDYEAQERLNQRRNRGSYESVYPTGAVINEDVVSDGELRKFFNELAKRALKSGDAKSAAQKSVKVNRISQAQPQAQQQDSNQAAPEAPQATQAAGATPAHSAAQAAPEAPKAAPEAPAAAPKEQPVPGLKLSDEEKEFFDALGADTKLGSQVKANDPLVQELAQKVMQAAFERYKAANPGKK
jgi:dTMP kinase